MLSKNAVSTVALSDTGSIVMDGKEILVEPSELGLKPLDGENFPSVPRHV